MAWGTLSTIDLLASNPAVQTVAQVGELNVWQSVDALFQIHNELVMEQANDLTRPTVNQQEFYGGGDAMTMDEIDQFGTPDTQKIAAGTTVGFPLRKYGRSIGWTRAYFEETTVDEFSRQVRSIFDADLLRLQTNIRKALYGPTNYTFQDRLVRNIALPVKALLNADSQAIPIGPNGETFNAATHTHYLAAAALNNTSMDALINAVLEHYALGSVRVYINKAQEATARGLTGFNPLIDVNIRPATTAQIAVGDLTQVNLQNRQIGYYDGGNGAAEVWVKPWTFSGYLFAFNPQAPKPLGWRTRPGRGQLRLMADDEDYPLRAQTYEREYGLAVWERSNGAVLQITGGSYGAPANP